MMTTSDNNNDGDASIVLRWEFIHNINKLKACVNGRNVVGQQRPALLRPFAHPAACCCVLLRVVEQSLKPVKLLATCKRTQQLPSLLGQPYWELLRPFAQSLT